MIGWVLLAVALYWGVLEWADQARVQREPKLTARPYIGAAQVSVIIPARNEVLNLPRCLEALLGQTYTPLEIIVVDDNSSDGTEELVEQYPRVTLIRGGPLAAGWTGKCYALHQGVERTRGDWLLFVDADTCLEPGGLAAALAYGDETVDLLSLTARQEAVSIWEQAVQPIIFGLLNRQYPLGTGGIAANGQFILVRRDAYTRVGTHRAVRGAVVEDVALARAFHQQGYRVHFINGTGLFRTRMYRGLQEVWEGWSKNSFRLFWPQVLETLAQLSLRLLPWAGLVVALMVQDGAGILINGLVLAWGMVVDARIRERQAFAPSTVLWQLPGAVLTLAILINSGLRQVLGLGTTWKGRSYPTTTE
ncbi:glycosyltransferase family 2 protein [Candidatus Cyanaurora vandensis]|uniref:glycosyltransferase n=1 Tax=Candidatus Cyanaurora vandensis TaxID=2714958 RepID=UPI00257D49B8|nr:glycosyltransferase family 2 protein [Candidatus Cyanaurora vandensis]